MAAKGAIRPAARPSTYAWAWPLLWLAWFALLLWQSSIHHPWSLDQLFRFFDLSRFGNLKFAAALSQGTGLIICLFLLAGIWAGAWALGRVLLARFFPAARSRLEASALAVGLGLAAQALLLFALGALGGFTPSMAWALWTLCAAWGGFSAWQHRAEWRPGRFRFWAGRPWPDRLLLILLAGLAGFILLASTAPEIFYDSLVYHLAVPAAWIKRRGFVPLPSNFFSNLPMSMELYYTWALLLFDERLARLWHMAFWFLLGAGTLAVARRHAGARAARWTAGVALAVPLTVINAGESGVDVAAAAFALLSVSALLAGPRSDGQAPERWPILAGILAGAALGIKYNAAFLLAPAAAVLLWPVRPWPVRWGEWIKTLAKFGTAAAVWVLPWMGKSWLFTGDPVFPFGFRWFHSPLIDPVKMQAQMDGFREYGQRTLGQFLRQPWDLTFYYPTGNSYIGAVFLFLLPAGLWLFWRWRQDPPWVRRLLGVCAAALLIWATQTQITRYLMPLFPWLALLGWLAVGEWERRTPWLGTLARWGVLALLLWGAGNTGAILLSSWDPLGVALGWETRSDYLDRMNLNSYAPMTRVVNALPAGAKVLSFGEARTYYFKPEVTAATVYDRQPLLVRLDQGPSAEQVWQDMRREGYTHLFAHWPEAERTRGYEAYRWTPAALERFRELISWYLRPVAFRNGQWLYALRAAPDRGLPKREGRPLALYDPEVVNRVVEHYRRVYELQRSQQWLDLETAYMRMQDLAPEWWVPYVERGTLYLHLNRFAEAWEQYQRAEALAWLDPVSSVNLGLLYLHFGRPVDALAPLRYALDLEPGLAAAAEQLRRAEAAAAEHLKRAEAAGGR